MATAVAPTMRMLSIEPLRRQDHVVNQRLAEAAADRLLDDEASPSFEYIACVDGVDLYHDPATHGVKAVAVVPGTVQSLVHSLATQGGTSSQMFRKAMFQHFGDSFVDGLRLHSDPSPVSLFWLALQQNHTEFDMTFLTSTRAYDDCGAPLTLDATSSDDQPSTKRMHVGVQVWQSVPLPGHADTPYMPAASATRLALRPSGFIVEAIDDPHAAPSCSVSFVLQFQAAANHHDLVEWMQGLAHSATLSFRGGMQMIVPKSLWTFNAYCYLCFKSFGAVFSRRHHCRLCGHSICAKCTTTVSTTLLAVAHTQDLPRGQTRVTTCTKCPQSLSKTPQPPHQLLHGSPVAKTKAAPLRLVSSSSTHSTCRLTDASLLQPPTTTANKTASPSTRWDSMDLVPILESVKPPRHSTKPFDLHPSSGPPQRRVRAAGLFRISPTDCTLVYASKTAPSEVGSDVSSCDYYRTEL